MIPIILSTISIIISIILIIIHFINKKYLHIHIDNKDIDKIVANKNIKFGFDPHHNNSIEWMYNDGLFYQRQIGHATWHFVKRFHATPARIELLYKLINNQ